MGPAVNRSRAFLPRVPVAQWELPLSHGGGGLIDKQEMENPKKAPKSMKTGWLHSNIYIYILLNIGNLPHLGSFRSIDGCNFCVDEWDWTNRKRKNYMEPKQICDSNCFGNTTSDGSDDYSWFGSVSQSLFMAKMCFYIFGRLKIRWNNSETWWTRHICVLDFDGPEHFWYKDFKKHHVWIRDALIQHRAQGIIITNKHACKMGAMCSCEITSQFSCL